MGRPIDPLQDYRNRRDFAATPEPVDRPAAPAADRPIFVVQRHEASRLHYDLRLESGGSLLSWAVPKGIPQVPGERRLAVRTENHPLAYAGFEGVIPPGQYGAGTMTILDRGPLRFITDPTAGLAAGELKFVLEGSVIRGEWHLVEVDGGDWLLLKHRDRYARAANDPLFPFTLFRERRAPLPRSFRPALPGGEEAAFDDPAWTFAPELPGLRVGIFLEGDSVRIRGARKDLSPLFPDMVADCAQMRAEVALLDGVLVALDDEGRPDESRLAARLRGDASVDAQLYVLDLLHFENWSVRTRPLSERLQALRAIVPDLGTVLRVDPLRGEGIALSDRAASAGLPGIWARRLDAPSRPGAGSDWVRIPVASAPTVGSVSDALSPGSTRRSRVRITNRDRVYWPELGLTKGQLLDYYAEVASRLLPHLVDRPVHLYRFPDGIEGEGFFQKDAPAHTPEWVKTISIATSRGGREIRHYLCNDRDTLLYLVNLGSIDLHPWLGTVDAIDAPDRIVWDLDPGAADFGRVVRVAREVGKILRGAGLRPSLKTSGSRGLHITLPIAAIYTYEQVGMFTEAVARWVVRELPEIATVERRPARRGTRVYIDTLQNRRGQTVVPPYVVRPVAAASVAVPLEWDELDLRVEPSAFPFPVALERFRETEDFAASLLGDPQDLAPAIDALSEAFDRGREDPPGPDDTLRGS